MTRKKKAFNNNENSQISDIVDMPSISEKKKAEEPRQEKQNSIILNETYFDRSDTTNAKFND